MHFDDWTDMVPQARVEKAISGLVLDHCFYGAIALHLEHVADPTCETMWVDGVVVGYNPEFVKGLSLPDLRFIQAHEYSHVANKHHVRRGNRDRKLWNEACDYVINLMLHESGLKLPPNILFDRKYEGMSTEQVYAILDDKRRQEEEQEQKSKEEEKEESQDDSQSQSGSQEEDDFGEEETESEDEGGEGESDDGQDLDEIGDQAGSSGEGEDEQDSQEGTGEDTSGMGEGGEGEGEGEGGEGEGAGEGEGDSDGQGGDPNAVGDVGGCGEVRDAPDQSETGIREEEAKWDIVVTQAAKLSERMGNMPAGMRRIIDEVLAPKVHWEEALSRWVVEQANTDYSWQKPNRRYLSQGIYLPGLHGDELLPIAFIVDTSGSQDVRAINQCASEIQAALSCYFTEFSVPVIYCDAVVQGVDEINSFDDVKLNPVGGGGTDFRPPFKYIEDEQIDIEGVIYLTDGHCYQFPKEPDYPVLWVIVPRGKRDFTPPFGEVISMND